MKLRFLAVWCWVITSVQFYSLANGQTSDSREYLGTVCKSHIGDARIQNSAGIDTSTLNNINMEKEALTNGGVMVDEECLQFIIFSECISTLQPCQGTVWCGEQSKAQLRDKAEEVCTCMGTQMCETALYQFLARINAATTYTETSAASAGTCQHVTEEASTNSANTATGVQRYFHWIGLTSLIAMVLTAY